VCPMGSLDHKRHIKHFGCLYCLRVATSLSNDYLEIMGLFNNEE